MTQTSHHDPDSTSPGGIERELAEARQSKALAHAPAIRRLKWVTRAFFLFGIASLFMLVPALFAWVWYWQAVESGADVLVYIVTVIATGANQFVAVLLLIAYSRFGMQLHRNQIARLSSAISTIGRLWNWGLGLCIVAVTGLTLMQRAEWPASLATNVWVLVSTLVLYAVMRHYLRTAKAELPELAARAGVVTLTDGSRSWRRRFFKAA